MSRWLVGIDAGGTSTRALALDAETGHRREGRAEGANWTVHGSAVCRERIGGLVSRVLPPGVSPGAACVAIAGYYPPDHASAAEAWAAETWPDIPARVVPDVLAAWAGAHAGEAGIVLISGTGSICYGRSSCGQEARSGGWGPLFSDQGSAYWVGLQCLRRLADQADGIGTGSLEGIASEAGLDGTATRTVLADRVPARWPQLGTELRDWLRGIYRQGWGREQVSALATEVAIAARDGDAVAARIIEEASWELFQMACAVERRLDEPHLPLALQGGLAPLLRETLARILTPAHAGPKQMRLVEPRFSPLRGALLLAGEALDGPAGLRSVRDRLA